MERTGAARMTDAVSGARRRLSLDGVWQFRHEDGPWREAHVPGPWQAEFSDLVDTSGRAVYKRSFALPEGWGSQELALQFGAVSYFCEVLLNGHVVGSHEGAFLPFEIVLPASSHKAQNELEVRVVMPSADHRVYPDYPFGEVPHGKISWYGRIGGLWQSVALEARDISHIEDVVITAGIDGRVSAELAFTASAAGLPVQLSVLDSLGAVVATADVTASGQVTATLAVAGAKLWSPDAPSLYSLLVDLGTDRVTQTFGFRTIETHDGQILLNGQPIYLRGALDQDYYPDGIYTPPSIEFLEDQARKAKHLGLNLLR
ncbi:MAG: sugar-binding domain-containing protein, partial [Devosia sp.]